MRNTNEVPHTALSEDPGMAAADRPWSWRRKAKITLFAFLAVVVTGESYRPLKPRLK